MFTGRTEYRRRAGTQRPFETGIGSSLGGILAETLSVQVMFLIMAVGPTLGLFIRMLSGVLCRKSRANALG